MGCEADELWAWREAYARLGWPQAPAWWPVAPGVCACEKGPGCGKNAGKHPIGRCVRHGLHDATTDLDVLRGWHRRYPLANIILPTVRFHAWDFDQGDGDPVGALCDFLEEAGEDLPDPDGITMVRTGSGGLHWWMAPAAGAGNRAGLLRTRIDYRGEGGYVIAPPSLHASWRRYEFVQFRPSFVKQGTVLAALAVGERATAPPPPGSFTLPDGAVGTKGAVAWARVVLDRTVATPSGGRNQALNRAAHALYRVVAAGELDEATVDAWLAAAGAAMDQRVGTILPSAKRAGFAAPRSLAGGRNSTKVV